MIRYAQQTDTYSCGPTAIVNALKWCGERISYRKRKREFLALCKCDPEMGTRPTNLDKALRIAAQGKMRVTKRKYFSLEEMERHLAKTNGSVILRFKWPHVESGHYVLLTDARENGQWFRTINLMEGCPAAPLVISRTEVKNILLRKRSLAICWFLTKEQTWKP